VVALLILSISVITIYNLIISTSLSTQELEKKYLAKEVASNRLALINTIEKPLKPTSRKGEAMMGGFQWQWEESFKRNNNEQFLEYEILVKLENQEEYIYATEGIISYE
jgi:type II secretion system protein I